MLVPIRCAPTYAPYAPPTMESVVILRPEGPSLALRSQPAVSDDAHLGRAQFHATHAHHADIAHTQNSHRASSRPPACSHSETNRPGANFHRPRIPRPPLLIQPHFADRVSGVVSHRANPPPYSLSRKAVRSRYATRRKPPRRFQYSHSPSDPFDANPTPPVGNAGTQNCRTLSITSPTTRYTYKNYYVYLLAPCMP